MAETSTGASVKPLKIPKTDSFVSPTSPLDSNKASLTPRSLAALGQSLRAGPLSLSLPAFPGSPRVFPGSPRNLLNNPSDQTFPGTPSRKLESEGSSPRSQSHVDHKASTRQRNQESAAWMLPAKASLARGTRAPGTTASAEVRRRLMEGTLTTVETAVTAAAPATTWHGRILRGEPTAMGLLLEALASASGSAVRPLLNALTFGRRGKSRLVEAVQRRKGGRPEVSMLRDQPTHRQQRGQDDLPLRALMAVRIQPGDTLDGLGKRHGLSVRELQRLNGMETDALFVGDAIRVPDGPLPPHRPEPRRGQRRTNRVLLMRPRFVQPPCVCTPARCLAPESRPLHSLAPPSLKTLPGPGGTSPSSPSPCRCWGVPLSQALAPDSRQKGACKGAQQGWVRRPKPLTRLTEGWLPFGSPVNDREWFISSPFGPRWGRMHEGADVAADEGVPIYAVAAGRVAFSGNFPVYGTLVEVQHSHGFMTRYAHCHRVLCKEGQAVKRGQILALVGSTGRATGPHLHLEVRQNGTAMNPLKWCNM